MAHRSVCRRVCYEYDLFIEFNKSLQFCMLVIGLMCVLYCIDSVSKDDFTLTANRKNVIQWALLVQLFSIATGFLGNCSLYSSIRN